MTGRGTTRTWAYSALRVASETRDVECALALIKGGANVNQIIGDVSSGHAVVAAVTAAIVVRACRSSWRGC